LGFNYAERIERDLVRFYVFVELFIIFSTFEVYIKYGIIKI